MRGIHTVFSIRGQMKGWGWNQWHTGQGELGIWLGLGSGVLQYIAGQWARNERQLSILPGASALLLL